MMRYLGIDPGLTGGLAALDSDGGLTVAPMPVAKIKGKSEIIASAVADLLEGWSPFVFGLVEHQWTRPKDARTRAFKTGYGYGVLIGVLATMGIPYRAVSPQLWRREIRVTGDKEAARFLALQLWPHEAAFKLKKNDGLAEAALIAAVAKAEAC